MTGQLGAVVMVAIIFLLMVLVLASGLSTRTRWLVAGGLVMRAVGTGIMVAIIYGFYRGVADAVGYFNIGTRYWDRMMSGDFSMFSNSAEWAAGEWWGAQFMYFLSAPVAGLLGPGKAGGFLLFSLLSFTGLCLFALAFHRSYPHVPVHRYLAWLFFFPSLWLWPSVLGKEAVILFGMGLLVFGFCRPGRVAWIPSAAGLLLVFCIRPQVAAVIVVSVIAAEWTARGQRWTPLRVIQAAVIVVAGAFLIARGLSLVGVGDVGAAGVGEYLEERARSAEAGRSAVEGPQVGITAVPQALVNTLFRPFPWEATNVMALASALEIGFLWIVALARWRSVLAAIRGWRGRRFMAMGLPFVLLYAATFGMVIVNLGIIARQRIFLFPFLFALVEGARAPEDAPRRAPAPARMRRPGPLPALSAAPPRPR